MGAWCRRIARGVGAPQSARRPRGVLCVRAGRSDDVPEQCTTPPDDGNASSTRRAALVGAALMTAASLPTRPALAKTVNLTVKDLSTKVCANPQAAGVPGSSTYKVRPPSATTFRATGVWQQLHLPCSTTNPGKPQGAHYGGTRSAYRSRLGVACSTRMQCSAPIRGAGGRYRLTSELPERAHSGATREHTTPPDGGGGAPSHLDARVFFLTPPQRRRPATRCSGPS